MQNSYKGVGTFVSKLPENFGSFFVLKDIIMENRPGYNRKIDIEELMRMNLKAKVRIQTREQEKPTSETLLNEDLKTRAKRHQKEITDVLGDANVRVISIGHITDVRIRR